jgi:hypothetical protein
MKCCYNQGQLKFGLRKREKQHILGFPESHIVVAQVLCCYHIRGQIIGLKIGWRVCCVKVVFKKGLRFCGWKSQEQTDYNQSL